MNNKVNILKFGDPEKDFFKYTVYLVLKKTF